MTTAESPIPRLSPTQVLAVLDQIALEAEEANRMAAWEHDAVCNTINLGIWQPGTFCAGCRFDVDHANHITQYLLIPVKDKPCARCNSRGVIPDFKQWNEAYGEPKPVPCPDCKPGAT